MLGPLITTHLLLCSNCPLLSEVCHSLVCRGNATGHGVGCAEAFGQALAGRPAGRRRRKWQRQRQRPQSRPQLQLAGGAPGGCTRGCSCSWGADKAAAAAAAAAGGVGLRVCLRLGQVGVWGTGVFAPLHYSCWWPGLPVCYLRSPGDSRSRVHPPAHPTTASAVCTHPIIIVIISTTPCSPLASSACPTAACGAATISAAAGRRELGAVAPGACGCWPASPWLLTASTASLPPVLLISSSHGRGLRQRLKGAAPASVLGAADVVLPMPSTAFQAGMPLAGGCCSRHLLLTHSCSCSLTPLQAGAMPPLMRARRHDMPDQSVAVPSPTTVLSVEEESRRLEARHGSIKVRWSGSQ